MDKQQLEQEFLRLVENNQKIIYKVCYVYATDSEHLNDLYQEVVINLWKSFSQFRGESLPSTWVYRVGLNTCVSFYRKEKSKPEVVPLSFDLPIYADQDNTEEQLLWLYRMINRLGQMERALILLWLEEKSYHEIAEITGISRNHVAVKLSRIREKLKMMSNQLNI
ncbi:MAG: RNA polymerase sigma factor [Bacteroidales bacterium]